MKHVSIVIFISLLIVSCSGVKETQTAINQGNYDNAIEIAVDKLVSGKNLKRNQEYIPLLEDAFKKANEQDLLLINRWNLDPNPAVLEPIYEAYLRLDRRQNLIRPLLPLREKGKNNNAQFDFKEYDVQILNSRTELSNHLLKKSSTALNNATTIEARQIYDDLIYLDGINPDFKNTRALIQTALELGTHYVLVSLTNESQVIIPEKLENELLNFSTYGINNKWIQYHNNTVETLDYDYGIDIIITNISVSPEQVLLKELVKEKEIIDGYIYEYDANGNVKKDSLGNDIKKDKLVTIKANVLQNTQLKESTVTATVQVRDNNTRQIVDRFPVNSNFVFTYLYGSVYGDRRALDANYIETLNPQAIPFPSDEQMVYETGEDLKFKIKQILLRINYD